jgi:hypothetical protein
MKVYTGLDKIIREMGYIGRNSHEHRHCMARCINMNRTK